MTRNRIPLNLYAPKHWPTWVGIGLLRSLSFIPYRFSLKLSSLLGLVFFPLARRRKHIIETNIKVCFPEKTPREQRQLCRKAFASTIMALFELSLAWWGSAKTLTQLHRVEGLEHLQNALKKGKGVILISSHFTTMEIAGSCLCQHVDNLILTYKRSTNPVIEFFIRRNRTEQSAGLIKHKNLREILRSIKSGNVVWFAPDQDFGTKDSIFAPFMGTLASTLLSTQRIAKITGAPVITFYGARLEDGTGYAIRLSPELENFPSENDLQDATKINDAIGKQVRQTPEQYLWAHRRFKTRPPGEKEIYTRYFGLFRYRLLISLLFVPLVLYTAWQSFRQREFRYFLQRFALAYPGTVAKNGIWIHAASVGEVNAAIPLLLKVHAEHPEVPVTLTTNTLTGAAMAKKQLPGTIQHIYFPLDYRYAIKRIVKKINPRAIFVIETELWPNLYVEVYKKDIPLIILNGRVSEKTLKAGKWLKKIYAQILPVAAHVYTRSETDKTRFIGLGSPRDKIDVMGNIKFYTPGPQNIEPLNPGRPYVLAASTREDEEQRVVEAWLQSEREDLLLVIVPRHIKRLSEIQKKLAPFNLNIACRSRQDKISPETDIYIADTMGELKQFIAGAEFVLMGGSFVEKGGHNILEVAQLGKAVIFGPDMRSFADEARLFLEYNAGIQSDIKQLPVYFNQLIHDNSLKNELEKNTATLIAAYKNVFTDYYKIINQSISTRS